MDNYASLGAVCQEFKSKYDVLQTKTENRATIEDKNDNYSSLKTEYEEPKPQYEVIGSKHLKPFSEECSNVKSRKAKKHPKRFEEAASPEYVELDHIKVESPNDLKPTSPDCDRKQSTEKRCLHFKIERRMCIVLGILIPLLFLTAIAGGLAYHFTLATGTECTIQSTDLTEDLQTTMSLVSSKLSVDKSVVVTNTVGTPEIFTTEEPDVSTFPPETTTLGCVHCYNGGTCVQNIEEAHCSCVKGFYGDTCERDGTYLLPDGILRNIARLSEGGTCTISTNSNNCNILIDGTVNFYGSLRLVLIWYPSDILEFNFSEKGSDMLELVIYQDLLANIKDILVTINNEDPITFQLEGQDSTDRPHRSSFQLYFPNATKARVQLLTIYRETLFAGLVEIQFLTKVKNPRYPADNPINIACKLYGGDVMTYSAMSSDVKTLNDDNRDPFYWRPSANFATVRFNFITLSRIRRVRFFYTLQSAPALISFDNKVFKEFVLPSIEEDESYYEIDISTDTVSDYMTLVFENTPLHLSEVMIYGYHEYRQG